MDRFRLVAAWTLMVGAIITWPIALLTWAKSEPPFVLSLSYLALIYEAFNAIQVASDNKKREAEEGGSA